MTPDERLASLVPKSDVAPHRAVVWVEAEVHEVTQYGEMSGSPKDRIARFPLEVTAPDRPACVRRLNELLARLKDLCKTLK